MFWKRKPKVGLLPKILGGLLCAVVVVASAVGGSALAMKIADSDSSLMQRVRENPIVAKVLPQNTDENANATEQTQETPSEAAMTEEPMSVDAVTSAPTGPIDYRQNPFVAIVKKSSPAVVNIDVETIITQKVRRINPFGGFDGDPFFEEFFGDAFPFFGGGRKNNGKKGEKKSEPKEEIRKIPRRGKGSGFLINSDGYILTNNHVVEEADTITVTLLDGRSFKAKLVGKDPTFDLAVIKIVPKNNGEKEAVKKLPYLPLGNSDATEVGEFVVAIGNPHGFENTVTSGIVSAKNRTLQDGNINFQGFLQTDAAINPGNSGGPLLNIRGEVVGINTAIVPYAQGLGFAIPVNPARQIMDDLIKHGEVRRGWLGCVVQNLMPALVEAYNIPVKEGSIISNIESGSPAEKAGLKVGDVIVKVGAAKIKNNQDVVFAVRSHLAGEKVPFEIYRDGKKQTVTVTLAEIKDSKTGVTGKSNGKDILSETGEKYGIKVRTNSKEYATSQGLKESNGVVVLSVSGDSELARIGLQPKDVILEINRKKINTVSDFKNNLNAKAKAIGMLISRDGQTLFLSYSSKN